MYLSALAIWLGWALFYGSVAVFVACGVGWVLVPWEERELEARFGEAYLRYKNRVPRWLGKTARRCPAFNSTNRDRLQRELAVGCR